MKIYTERYASAARIIRRVEVSRPRKRPGKWEAAGMAGRVGHLISSGADTEYEELGVEVLHAPCHGARSRTAPRAANRRNACLTEFALK